MQTSSFDAQGMTCGGCTGKAQRALSKLDSVHHVDIRLRSDIATVQVDPARVTSAQIESVIGLAHSDRSYREINEDRLQPSHHGR